MAVVLIRHGERQDYADKSWLASAARPWDPPLTDSGKRQAQAAGKALTGLLQANGLPPVSKVLASPLTRCVETALEVADYSGHNGAICVEPSLMEIISKDWYHSWGVPGANSEWGGPPHCRVGTPVSSEELHPSVLLPTASLLRGLEDLQAEYGDRLNEQYSPVTPPASLKGGWHSPESTQETKARLEALAAHCASEFPEETVVWVTHGGPTIYTCQSLCDNPNIPDDCPYTATYILTKKKGQEGWTASVSRSIGHLGSNDDLGLATVGGV